MQPSRQAAGKLGLGHFAFTSVVLTLCTPEIIFKVGGSTKEEKILFCELFLKNENTDITSK